MNVVWSPTAIQKAAAISEYIAADSPAAAKRWLDQLFDKVDLLADMPEMGRQVPELDDPCYREMIIGNYRVVYSVTEQINVLAVRNQRQLFRLD